MSDDLIVALRALAQYPGEHDNVSIVDEAADEIDALRAENEALRQDAERYRAIVRMITVSPYSAGTYAYMLRVKGVTFETAIDAAMKANGSPESS